MAEAAEEGDEEALEELQTDGLEAIEAMIGAMEEEESRRLIGLGMMLAQNFFIDNVPAGAALSFEELDARLDMVQQQLAGVLESSPALKD